MDKVNEKSVDTKPELTDDEKATLELRKFAADTLNEENSTAPERIIKKTARKLADASTALKMKKHLEWMCNQQIGCMEGNSALTATQKKVFTAQILGKIIPNLDVDA